MLKSMLNLSSLFSARTNKIFRFSEELQNNFSDVVVGREVKVEVDRVVDARHDVRLKKISLT